MGALGLFLFTTFLSFFNNGVCVDEGCHSPQYIEIGTVGTVVCSFQGEYYGILWYNSKNYVTATSLMHYQEYVKGGDGYESGEFDIYPNGSLIIKNVSLEHDHYFTAVKLSALSGDLTPHYVRVVAIVIPFNRYPVIKSCGSSNSICFITWTGLSSIECSVTNSRPAVNIQWAVRTVNGDRNISSSLTVNVSGILSTSVATTLNPFMFTSLLSLLVCKADSPNILFINDESLILVENDRLDLSTMKPARKYFQLHSRLELSCSGDTNSFLVWKIQNRNDEVFRNIIYAVYDGDEITKYISDGYDLGTNGSVMIPTLEIQNEALYGCIYGNGTEEGIHMYEIIIYVPSKVDIKGCPSSGYCSLETDRQGSLTCAVQGIRPRVKLTWKESQDISSSGIVFYNQQTTISHNKDDTFDVSATAEFEARRSPYARITVKCQTIEESIDLFHLSKNVELIFQQGNPTTQDLSVENGKALRFPWWIMIAVIFVLSFITVSLGILKCKGNPFERRNSPEKVDQEAGTPMLPTDSTILQLKENNHLKRSEREQLVRELKRKYEELCAVISPVPFIRDKLFGIDKVFVEGNLYFLKAKGNLTMMDSWELMKSYRDIFTDARLESNRRIVEGDPGYGKSTLTLQWAYEWLQNDKQSYLKDVDLFILLRLRQLGNTVSIFKAIKQFLLPVDTKFDVDDIERIVRECNSVVIILDGFDEYHYQELKAAHDIISIIKREMLQECKVILTTRSSCLPSEYSPSTKRIKLDGFNNKARDAYLRKVVVGNDNLAAEEIKEKLRENPFLDDLCQVPLFFVMFAHIAKYEVNIVKFKSVTLFFRHVISCFHSHMKNKMKDANVQKYDLFEKHHFKLDLVSFQALLGKDKQIVWNKEYLRKQLGDDFYEQYVKIGILIEEDVLCVNEESAMLDPYQYKTEVRFYHKLFCEWYAAHFLAKYLENPEENLDVKIANDVSNNDDKNDVCPEAQLLQHVDPYELEYLYRFTCGLNSVAAEKVCVHLKSRYGGDKFFVLCLLEQSENFEKMEKYITKLCSTNIIIHGNHNKLLQRSTCQLLQIASQRKITIRQLQFFNCFRSAEPSGNYLLMTSGVKLPILTWLSKLLISDSGREMICDDMIGIFNFCLQCLNLTVLKFEFCLLPQKLKVENLQRFNERNVKVLWQTEFSPLYQFNVHSGQWEHHGGGVMSKDEYEREVNTFWRLQQE